MACSKTEITQSKIPQDMVSTWKLRIATGWKIKFFEETKRMTEGQYRIVGWGIMNGTWSTT